MGHVEHVDASIQETSLTAGHIRLRGYKFDVAATAGEQTFDISVPFDADALSADMRCHTAEEGDNVSIVVAPATVIGQVDNASGYAIGDKVIKVDATVLANTWVGQMVTFSGDETKKYWITARDTATNEITIWRFESTDDGLEVAVADDEVVKLHTHLVQHAYLYSTEVTTVGTTKIGGSGIAANTTVRVVFDNASATAKTLYMNVELLYGDV